MKGSGEIQPEKMLLPWAVSRDPAFYCASLGSGAGDAEVLTPHIRTAVACSSPLTFPDFSHVKWAVTHTSLKLGSNDQVKDTGLEGMNSRMVVGTLKA